MLKNRPDYSIEVKDSIWSRDTTGMKRTFQVKNVEGSVILKISSTCQSIRVAFYVGKSLVEAEIEAKFFYGLNANDHWTKEPRNQAMKTMKVSGILLEKVT